MKTIITKIENGRVIKYLPIQDEYAEEKLIELVLTYPGAFIYDGEYTPELFVDNGVVTSKPIQETSEQTIARLERVLDRHLDAVANLYRYESIRTMVTYATSEHPTFGKEGKAAVAFRDAVYAYGIQCIVDVNNGLRSIPTEEELISELPLFTDYLV